MLPAEVKEGYTHDILCSNPEFAVKIMNFIPVGIFLTLDKSCRTIRYNLKAAEFLRIKEPDNFSSGELSNIPVKLYHQGKELFPAEMLIKRTVWYGEEIKEREIEFFWEDRIQKTAIWNSIPLLDENKCIIGAIATLEDITERKSLEKKLEKLEKLEAENSLIKTGDYLESLINCVNVPIILWDASGKINRLNNAFERLTGYKAGDILGRSLEVLFPESIKEEILDRIRHISSLHGEQWKAVEIPILKADGSIRTILWNFSDVFKSDGAGIVATIAYGQDITERIQAENILKESGMRYRASAEKLREVDLRLSEERFSKVFLANPVAMTIKRLKDSVYQYVNDSFLKMTGFSREEVVGHTASELNIWVDLSERRQLVKKFYNQGALTKEEFNYRTKSGQVRSGVLTSETIGIDGDKSILEIIYDITDQKRLRKEMARLDRLHLVGEMAAGIGHEIRNPMTAVRGFIQLMMEKKELQKYIEFFEIMISELDRANSIITEFLSLAKNKAVKFEPKNLNTVLRSIYPLMQADGFAAGMDIYLETQEIPDLLLDEKEIRQLIFNMVRNGLEAMEPGGILTIKTHLQDDQVILSVKDKGRGIEPQVLEKLGTPFFTTKENGTGLGLAVCYSVAQRHGAKINIVSNTYGTTFFVRFKQTQ